MSVYSADGAGMLFGSRELAVAAELIKVIRPEYAHRLAPYAGAWGERGVGDDFAESVIPLTEEEQEAVQVTLDAMLSGIQALFSMVTEQIDIVKMPQVNALDAIDAQGRKGT